MEMTFFEPQNRYERVNDADNETTNKAALTGTGLAIGGPVAAGILVGLDSIASGLNQQMKNAANEGLYNYIKATGTRGLPYYPTKGEMAAAAKTGGWEDHILQAIMWAYDDKTGTWDAPLDDWKGAVFSINPIKAYIFKGAGQKYEKDSNIVATENGLKAIKAAQQQQQTQQSSQQLVGQLLGNGQTTGLQTNLLGGSNTPNLSASVMGSGADFSNPILWVVLGAIVLVTIFLLIKS